ncbi:MAG: triose-phosphate isomerase [Thermomicrobiales bacterium]
MNDNNRRPLILGNWKMNTSLQSAVKLTARASAIANAHPDVDVGILPPAVWLVPLSLQTQMLNPSRLSLGAQDVSQHANGAFTGDLSMSMFVSWCDYILVGHSERRQHHHESDDVVRAKLDAVFATECIPVLAVGESGSERDSGHASAVVERQLNGALAGRAGTEFSRLVVAYEPVWAIGTGASASADDAQKMARVIRAWLERQDSEAANMVRILYGGSMKPENASEILAKPDVDGGLIGGASLDADDFEKIVEAAVLQT